jgi:uncharacterized membrane protein
MPLFIKTVVDSLGADRIFLLFLIYSFVGWVSEVLYVAAFVEHKFVNRGFLHGPICPIYGTGGIIILFLPVHIKQTGISLFISSMFFCTLLEYISSWIMEKLFQAKWWDYSQMHFNLNGRVCLLNSLLFGLMGYIAMTYVQPSFKNILFMLNDTVTYYLAVSLGIIFLIDLFTTIRKLVDFNASLARLKEFSDALKERYTTESWFRSGTISEMLSSIKERSATGKTSFSMTLLNKIESFNHPVKAAENIINRFPTIKSTTYPQSLEHLRNRVHESIRERRLLLLKKRNARKNRKEHTDCN